MKKQQTSSQGNRSGESKRQSSSKVRNKEFNVVEIFSIQKKILFYKKDMPIDDELQTLPDNFALHEVGESSRKRLKLLKRFFSDSDYLVECRIVMEAIGKKNCAF